VGHGEIGGESHRTVLTDEGGGGVEAVLWCNSDSAERRRARGQQKGLTG
jgi:hypothetical protein